MVKIGRIGNLKLQFSGKLRQSFIPSNNRLIDGGIVYYNPARTRGGFAYAEAHDEGGSKKGRPPQREFMWLSGDAMATISEKLLKWMAED
jgi:phage gpG-like protein